MRTLTAAASCLVASLSLLPGCHSQSKESSRTGRDSGRETVSKVETSGQRDEVEFKGRARVRRFSATTWVEVELPEAHRSGGDSIDIQAAWMFITMKSVPRTKGAVVRFDSTSTTARFKRDPELIVEFDEGRYSLGRMKRGVFKRHAGRVIEGVSMPLEYQLYKRIVNSKQVTFTINSIAIPVTGEQLEAMRDLYRVLDAEIADS